MYSQSGLHYPATVAMVSVTSACCLDELKVENNNRSCGLSAEGGQRRKCDCGSGEGRTRVRLINKWTDRRRRAMAEGHMAWQGDSVNEGGFKGQ